MMKRASDKYSGENIHLEVSGELTLAITFIITVCVVVLVLGICFRYFVMHAMSTYGCLFLFWLYVLDPTLLLC